MKIQEVDCSRSSLQIKKIVQEVAILKQDYEEEITWWAEPPWGHLGHVPGLHAATCRSSGGSAVVPAPKNVVCPEDDEQIRHRSVFPGTPLDPVFGPGNLFFLNFRKLGHESCCHRIWKSFQSKRAKRKKELQNPASLLGRKSQKAKRFGLRMVEGDIFRSERRSSK